MQLEFLNRLNEAQIIDLLNYINKGVSNHTVKQIQVFREPDRCDEFGNQQILINAWDDNFHIGMYTAQDFTMKEVFDIMIFEKEIREYMTSIFGEEYLNGLREYYAIQAEKEIERIKSTLGVGRS